MLWIALALAFVLLAAVPVRVNARRHGATELPHGTWPGRIADLPQGRTRYRWIGGVRGPVIVAIHGLTTPSEVWEPLARRLTPLGYRVLVYDLYGRGGSANGTGRTQDLAFHLRQLTDLLDHLGLRDELTLMGYSMGAQIAAGFAAAAPERVQRLVLIAAAGIDLEEGPFDRLCRRAPLIGDALQVVMSDQRQAAGADAIRAFGGEAAPIAAALDRQIGRRGYAEAVLSSRRATLAPGSEATYRAVAATGLPVVAIWGEADETVPITSLGKLAQWIRAARQETVPGAGHALLASHPDAVFDRLRPLLLEAA